MNETQMKFAAPLTAKDSKFVYTSGGNAQAIWRKYGWVAPSEVRTDYLFAKNREGGAE